METDDEAGQLQAFWTDEGLVRVEINCETFTVAFEVDVRKRDAIVYNLMNPQWRNQK